VLIAVIGQHLGWPPGYEPTDAELSAGMASNGKTRGTA
jgi:hypothetical protein